MVNYEPMVKGITAELEGLRRVPFADYAAVVKSRGLPNQQEEALLKYASDVYAINNVQWSAPSQATGQSSPKSRGGLTGLLGDLVDVASDILRIPVQIVGGVVSLGREMVVDPVLEVIVGTPDEIAERTQSYMTQTGNRPYDATRKRQEDVIQELNRMG